MGHMCTLSARASSALLMQSFCRPLAPSPLMCTLSARPLAPSPHVCTLSARASSALLIQSFCPAHSAIPLCTLSARPSVPSPHSAHGPNRPRACLRVGPTLHAGWPHANARVEHVPRTPVPRTGCLPTCPHGSAHASASLAALHMHPPCTHAHATATHAALYMRPAPTCCAGSNSPVHVFRGARSGCHRASIRLWLCPHARPPCGAHATATHAALHMRPAPTCCAGSNSPVHVFRGARSGCHRASIRLWLCPHARPPCGARAPTTHPCPWLRQRLRLIYALGYANAFGSRAPLAPPAFGSTTPLATAHVRPWLRQRLRLIYALGYANAFGSHAPLAPPAFGSNTPSATPTPSPGAASDVGAQAGAAMPTPQLNNAWQSSGTDGVGQQGQHGLPPLGATCTTGLPPLGAAPAVNNSSLPPLGAPAMSNLPPLGAPPASNGLPPLGATLLGNSNGLPPLGATPVVNNNGLPPRGTTPLGNASGLPTLGTTPLGNGTGLPPLGATPVGNSSGLPPLGATPANDSTGLPPLAAGPPPLGPGGPQIPATVPPSLGPTSSLGTSAMQGLGVQTGALASSGLRSGVPHRLGDFGVPTPSARLRHRAHPNPNGPQTTPHHAT